jgi:hypothetical protein
MLFFPEKALTGFEARARFLMERVEEGMDEPARDLLAAADAYSLFHHHVIRSAPSLRCCQP